MSIKLNRSLPFRLPDCLNTYAISLLDVFPPLIFQTVKNREKPTASQKVAVEKVDLDWDYLDASQCFQI